MSMFRLQPPRPVSERAGVAIRAIGGITLIVFGVVFAATSTIQYAPGDIRGTAAYKLAIGGGVIVLGIVSLLSIRFRRLRGRQRPRDE